MVIEMIDGKKITIKDFIYTTENIYTIADIIKTYCGDEFGHYVEDYIRGLREEINYSTEEFAYEIASCIEDIKNSYIDGEEIVVKLEVLIDDLKLLQKEYNE